MGWPTFQKYLKKKNSALVRHKMIKGAFPKRRLKHRLKGIPYKAYTPSAPGRPIYFFFFRFKLQKSCALCASNCRPAYLLDTVIKWNSRHVVPNLFFFHFFNAKKPHRSSFLGFFFFVFLAGFLLFIPFHFLFLFSIMQNSWTSLKTGTFLKFMIFWISWTFLKFNEQIFKKYLKLMIFFKFCLLKKIQSSCFFINVLMNVFQNWWIFENWRTYFQNHNLFYEFVNFF